MILEYNKSLKSYNTFGFDVTVTNFLTLTTANDCSSIIGYNPNRLPIFVLGGGSNVLLNGNIDKLLIKNNIEFISVIEESEDAVLIEVGAGVIWHEFVMHCVFNNYYGVENLALIPGTVGASPIQNIGAYGVEVKDVIEKVIFFNLDTQSFQTLNNDQCKFDYRDSIFKNELKNKIIATSVVFRLTKLKHLKLNYGNILTALESKNISDPTIEDVANTIIEIRASKLPDPIKIGNSGSFFKNPVVQNHIYDKIVNSGFSNVPFYKIDEEHLKIPAAWLIEQAGWKGFRAGDAGVHINQPLVLVNYGKATGEQILQLSTQIIESVAFKFGITLEREVQIID